MTASRTAVFSMTMSHGDSARLDTPIIAAPSEKAPDYVRGFLAWGCYNRRVQSCRIAVRHCHAEHRSSRSRHAGAAASENARAVHRGRTQLGVEGSPAGSRQVVYVLPGCVRAGDEPPRLAGSLHDHEPGPAVG